MDRTEQPSSFDKWMDAGAPDPAGDIDTAQAGLNAIQSLTELSRIYHRLASAQIDSLRDVLEDDVLDDAQNWLDLGLSDTLSDSAGALHTATENAAPSQELPIFRSVNFAAVTANTRVEKFRAELPTSESKSVDPSVIAAGLTGSEGDL